MHMTRNIKKRRVYDLNKACNLVSYYLTEALIVLRKKRTCVFDSISLEIILAYNAFQIPI